MITLAVDAATYLGTTALIEDGRVVAEGEAAMRGRDVDALMPLIAATLGRAKKSSRDLTRIVCGAGPGSFTSLRIAASIAKGVALGVACPMFVVSSLALLVAASVRPREGRYLAVLDALRGEAYVGGFAVDSMGMVSAILPECLVMQSQVSAVAQQLEAVTVGAGQKIDGSPRASGVLGLELMMRNATPIDLASWEPGYGRKAEAQARWEAMHGHQMSVRRTSL